MTMSFLRCACRWKRTVTLSFAQPTQREGLQKVREVKPDLILLDVMMDSMTAGFEVCRTIRNPDPASDYAAYRKIPIVMITAIPATASLRFAPDKAQLPVDAFVEKPIEPDILLSIVRDHIGKHRP